LLSAILVGAVLAPLIPHVLSNAVRGIPARAAGNVQPGWNFLFCCARDEDVKSKRTAIVAGDFIPTLQDWIGRSYRRTALTG